MRPAPDPTKVAPSNVFDVDELCAASGVGRNKLASALRDLEFAGFIVNLTPGNEPFKSLWRLTMYPYRAQPATHDYLKPEVIERLEKAKAERKAKRSQAWRASRHVG